MEYNALSRDYTRSIELQAGRFRTTTVPGVLFLFTLLATVCQSKDYRGRIQGLVRDSSSAVIAGATVTLNNVNTGISTVRKTNETGHYIFDLVEPGSYRVTIATPAFTSYVQENVPLAAHV